MKKDIELILYNMFQQVDSVQTDEEVEQIFNETVDVLHSLLETNNDISIDNDDDYSYDIYHIMTGVK